MSRKTVEFHADAIADVKAAVAWYQDRSPKAAVDFIEELERATKTISQSPHRWIEGKNGTRRFLMWRFPFVIIYSERESDIIIWAVAHVSRRPDFWQNRP